MHPGGSSISLGRYSLDRPIASGGMATVYLGRVRGDAGFTRLVAIKRLRNEIAKDPQFAGMLLDEARMATRIRHPNVVQPLDVVQVDGELLVAMEYVQGETLAGLLKKLGAEQGRIPLPVVSGIFSGALAGLHAAHEATNERGQPLDIIHRDVSPQNILIGADGAARIIDFGVAKVVNLARSTTTKTGEVKGKLSYMAPEQLRGEPLTRRADVFSASVVLWEALTGKRLFRGSAELVAIAVLEQHIEPPSAHAIDLPAGLDEVVLRGLNRDPAQRFATALDLATALEALVPPASTREISSWIAATVPEVLAESAELAAAVERARLSSPPSPPATKRLERTTVRDLPTPPATATPRRPRRKLLALVGILAVVGLAGAALAVRRGQAPTAAPRATTAQDLSAEPIASVSPPPPPLAKSAAPAPPPATEPSTSAPLPRAKAPKPAPRPTASPRPHVPLYGQY
jgi:eukaryotic-like serine/threonine-protein kinase